MEDAYLCIFFPQFVFSNAWKWHPIVADVVQSMSSMDVDGAVEVKFAASVVSAKSHHGFREMRRAQTLSLLW